MKEYVFFVKKRTLRLQRKSVKIAEKVPRAPIFLQKELANRLPDVVTLRWISKSNAIDMINYSIKLKHDVVDGAAVEGLGIGDVFDVLCCPPPRFEKSFAYPLLFCEKNCNFARTLKQN